jgi:hypothetical protein
MWECNQCRKANPDKNLLCEECGSIVPSIVESSDKKQKKKTIPAQHEKTCKQAKRLDEYGKLVVWFSWIICIWLYLGQVKEPYFSFDNISYSITVSIFAIMIGSAIKCLLESFAIIVEASYRSLNQ